MKPAIPINNLRVSEDMVEFNIPLERMSDYELLFMMQNIVIELQQRAEARLSDDRSISDQFPSLPTV